MQMGRCNVDENIMVAHPKNILASLRNEQKLCKNLEDRISNPRSYEEISGLFYVYPAKRVIPAVYCS